MTEHVADHPGEERVVGAAEEQGVDAGRAHRGEQPLGEHGHLVARRLAPLDELDEPGARRRRELHRSDRRRLAASATALP